MPTFIYKAKKGLKETIEGIIEAESRDAAASILSNSGLVPISLELKSSPKKQQQQVSSPILGFKKLGLKELTIFTQQLRTLLRSKVELLSSLNVIYKQTDNPKLKTIILDVHNSVKDGGTFSEGLSKFPDFFPVIYINIIKAGEASGKLDESLSRLSEFLEKEQDLKMKIKTALAYLVMMVMVGVGTIFVLFSFVIPKLMVIFTDFQADLPLPTLVLLKISNVMNRGWPLIIIFLATLIFFARKKNFFASSRSIDLIKTRLPVLGELAHKQAIARFANTLALLLHSGVPIFQSLQIAIPTLENRIFIQQLEVVHKEVLSGATLASSLKKVAFIPPFIIHMITVGEEGGRLEEVLVEIASTYTSESEAILKIITSLLEPLVILCLGLVLGFIIMAMLLPIFQINMLVK